MSEIFDFLLNHWMLSGTFLIIVAAYLYLELRGHWSGIAQVTPEQAVQLMNHQNAAVLDLRSKEEFNAGHIIHSVNIPIAELEQKSSKLNTYKNKKIILVTGDSQMTVALAVKKLRNSVAKDFDCSLLQGGLVGWRNAQLPLQKHNGS